SLKIWTSNPNGNLDMSNLDDTLAVVVEPSIFSAMSSNDTICLGKEVTLTLNSNGGFQGVGVQWEMSSDSVTFGVIAGADSLEYEVVNLLGDAWYKAVIAVNGVTCSSDTV